jgi:hypothetical protein
MEFTEPYKQTGPCCFSPDARFLAVAVDYRLVVRDVVSLKVPAAYRSPSPFAPSISLFARECGFRVCVAVVIAESGILELGNVTLCCSDSSLLIHRMRLLLPI